jgi:iron complex transport system ATP-binding protein
MKVRAPEFRGPRGAAILKARGLSAGYGAHSVLRDLDLSVAAGEAVAVIGPNGSGKTTLLRALSGTLQPMAGEVTLGGVPLSALTPRERARRIATVPQTFTTPFDFTAREIVALGRTPYVSLFGRLSDRDHAAVERAMQQTECSDLAGRPFAELSAGERQRVVVAMALAQGADVLLLDEPTAHLDLAHQLRTLAILMPFVATEGLAVVAAIHDLTLAAGRFERLLVMDEGRIVGDGRPRDILTAGLVSRVFDVDADVRWHDGTPTLIPRFVTPRPAERSDS